MAPSKKLCSLHFHEMPIKSNLLKKIGTAFHRENETPVLESRALVFMIRGLTQNWRQIIAYYFQEHSVPVIRLKDVLFETINKVHNCGFRIVATICNQSPQNLKLFKELGISVESPFFFFNESKIFTVYDMPHLFKSVGNCLKKYNVQFLQMKKVRGERKEMTASWADLEEFYIKDKIIEPESSKFSRRLTSKLIHSERLVVKDVKRVFSNKVAAGICAHSQLGQMQPKCQQTAAFISDMNDLFDSLNSEKIKGPGLSAAASRNGNHVRFWEECLESVKSWKFQASSRKIVKPTCQEGLQITLNAMIGIWNEFSKDLVHLMMSKLNLYSLDDIFSNIKRHKGFRENPSSFQFRNAIRSIIVPNLIKKSKVVVEPEDEVYVEYSLLDICKTGVCMMMIFSEDSVEDDIVTAPLDSVF